MVVPPPPNIIQYIWMLKSFSTQILHTQDTNLTYRFLFKLQVFVDANLVIMKLANNAASFMSKHRFKLSTPSH